MAFVLTLGLLGSLRGEAVFLPLVFLHVVAALAGFGSIGFAGTYAEPGSAPANAPPARAGRRRGRRSRGRGAHPVFSAPSTILEGRPACPGFRAARTLGRAAHRRVGPNLAPGCPGRLGVRNLGGRRAHRSGAEADASHVGPRCRRRPSLRDRPDGSSCPDGRIGEQGGGLLRPSLLRRSRPHDLATIVGR